MATPRVAPTPPPSHATHVMRSARRCSAATDLRAMDFFKRDRSGEAGTSGSGAGPSGSVRVHGVDMPVEWLVAKHNPQRFPPSTICTPVQVRQANRDIAWARHRDQWIAAGAAGLHLALFSFNLAFNGFEGMPPDRYNPTNIRQKLGVKPGRIGNMDGTKRIYYDNLARLEGVD